MSEPAVPPPSREMLELNPLLEQFRWMRVEGRKTLFAAILESTGPLNLVHRPILQLFHNHKASFFPSVLDIMLAHKPVSSDHNNVFE